MSRPTVFITQPIPRAWYQPLTARCRVVMAPPGALSLVGLKRGIRQADVVWSFLCDRISRDVLENAPRLRVVANCAAGVNNVDVNAATARGIWVTNTPGVLTEATADLTWALILGVTRRLAEGDRLVRARRFKGWRADLLLGDDLNGKVLGVIGMGRIGQAVARRAAAFGMRVRYLSRRRLSRGAERGLGATATTLGALLREADVLTLHTPLTEETRHLIGRKELAAMKPTAYLVNTARGPVVDERALAVALARGRLAGAGLDVYEREPAVDPRLLTLSNVVLAPHLGSATRETRARMAALTVQNILASVAGRKPPCLVNPEVLAK